MKLYAVYIPTTNRRVWKHPSIGTLWSECVLTQEVHDWLNTHAGVVSWVMGHAKRSPGREDHRTHLGTDIEFWNKDVALLFKLTWDGVC